MHETANEGWKADVEADLVCGARCEMTENPEAFVDGLSAMVARQQARMQEGLSSEDVEPPGSRADLTRRLDELGLEVSELQGRLENLHASLDSLLAVDDAG